MSHSSPNPSTDAAAPERPASSVPRIYLLLGLSGSLLFAWLCPPFRGADEVSHFLRALQIARGGFVAVRAGNEVGGFFPHDPRPVASSHRDPAAPATPVFFDFRKTAAYPPVPYLPQALALAAGLRLDLDTFALLRLARVSGGLVAWALIYLAMRTTPVAPHLWGLVALSPMGLRQLSTLSADSLTLALSLLLIALFLRLAHDAAQPVRSGRVLTLAAWAMATSLCKLAYAPLVLLFLLCPVRRFGTRGRYAAAFLWIAGLSLGALGLWFWIGRSLYLPQPIAPTADPAQQLLFILHHPLRFAGIVLNDLLRHSATYVTGCFGYGSLASPVLMAVHLPLFLAAGLLAQPAEAVPAPRARLLLALTFAAGCALIGTLNYLGWNPVGSDHILFVQGRYFLPLAPLFALALASPRLAHRVPERRFAPLALAAAALSVALTLWRVAHRFG